MFIKEQFFNLHLHADKLDSLLDLQLENTDTFLDKPQLKVEHLDSTLDSSDAVVVVAVAVDYSIDKMHWDIRDIVFVRLLTIDYCRKKMKVMMMKKKKKSENHVEPI